MPTKTAPDISHLGTKDIIAVMKEATASDIEKDEAFIASFFDRAAAVSKIDRADIDKLGSLMAASARGDGGCGSFSGGCC